MGFGLYSPYGGFKNSTTRKASANNGKRVKTVYSVDRIAHLWAHQTQDYARNGGSNNFYFDGDTIYSYGSHFPIARHVSYRGKRCILFTTRSYSVTTAGHISLVRGAIPPSIHVFRCEHPADTIPEVFAEYKSDIEHARRGLLEAKNKSARVKAYRSLVHHVSKANELCAFFGYKTRFTTKLAAEQTAALNQQSAEYDASSARRSAAAQMAADTRRRERNIRWERESAAREAQRAELAANRETWIAAALAGNLDTIPEWYRQTAQSEAREIIETREWESKRETLIANWRAGQDSIPWRFASDVPTMFRIVGDNVETSRGAEFPVDHAFKILPLVETLLQRGRTYQRNGHTIHLGHYSLDSIDENGTIRAGCHVIPKTETLSLIAQLKARPDYVAREYVATSAD